MPEERAQQLCTEAEARRIIGVEGAQSVVEIVRGAWQDYCSLGDPLQPIPRAGYVWDRMIKRAEVEFADFEGVEIKPSENSWLFVLHGRVAMRLKMLDSDHRTRNLATAAQKFNKSNGYFDGMPPDLPTISCGYVLDPTQSDIDKVLAVRELGRHVEWWFDLDDLAQGQLAPTFPILPDLGPDLPSLPSIRRVKRTEDGDNS